MVSSKEEFGASAQERLFARYPIADYGVGGPKQMDRISYSVPDRFDPQHKTGSSLTLDAFSKGKVFSVMFSHSDTPSYFTADAEIALRYNVPWIDNLELKLEYGANQLYLAGNLYDKELEHMSGIYYPSMGPVKSVSGFDPKTNAVELQKLRERYPAPVSAPA